MTKPRTKTTSRKVYIQPREIHDYEEFFHRDLECQHVRALTMTLKKKHYLDPITLWEDDSDPDQRRLVLLDGRHRLAAYRSYQWECRKGGHKGIPARIVSCSRETAHLLSVSDNAKDRCALTARERSDAAWHLVRRFRDGELSGREIAEAASVSLRTVRHMIARRRQLAEAGRESEFTGKWMTDRTDEEWQSPEQEEYAELIEKRLEAFKPAALTMKRDPDEIVWEVMVRSYGEQRLRAIFEYGLCNPDEPDEFAEMVEQPITTYSGTQGDPGYDF